MTLPSRPLRLGFIALSDCAPLAVAQEKGFFGLEGLNVELSREASWANIRDKVATAALDGAHMLGPLPIAARLGLSGEPSAMIAPMSLNLNGSAITVSTALAEAMRNADPQAMDARPRTARALASVIAQRREAGAAMLTFAVVFPFSVHNYQLRYWMAEAGIDPDRDVRITVVPPARMTARIASGDIDGFCVGAPWNAQAVADGHGEIMIYAAEFWSVGPDKVFSVTEGWADREPQALRSMLRALIQAAAWADEPGNRAELASILAHQRYVDAPIETVARSLVGSPPYSREELGSDSRDYIIYHRYAASFPWRSHAVWFLTQMLRWGQIGPDVDIAAAAEAAYRPDLYRAAAASLGEPAPIVDEKVEGLHTGPWTLDEATSPIAMAPDLFFDARRFDAAQPKRYAASFDIGRFREA
ncbi:MAG: CmpA/NrtA family ABC transporter substrate-binding protein [Phenylobacterium sp.]|uniref:CmpA/NrtA family ABC transporter substrate-binding protein n=1 Tax=Phenylobacterium sp. TaxID=1871053 RepID=UPI002735E238|nr:CmpA/NrtA family ABC transporter substrate-binding protein [Phenylobacterium sp.]MDP3173491.1 CmpA/NrtA family ABC transporter substrate-binding protein [Phenylobacterium sp.]